jgi:hypothetical protein
MFGCARKVTTSGTGGTGKYSEDLSVWRPETETVVDTTKATAPGTERTRINQYVEPRYAVNDQVDSVLDSIYEQNHKAGYIDGYTIQVYSGVKREDALNVKKKLSKSLPDLASEVQYRQPNFRVRTGEYLSRLEAQKDYLHVKRFFPNAIVIPDRIPIQ